MATFGDSRFGGALFYGALGASVPDPPTEVNLLVTSEDLEVLRAEDYSDIRVTSTESEVLVPANETAAALRATSVSVEYLYSLVAARITSESIEVLVGLGSIRVTSSLVEVLQDAVHPNVLVTSSSLEFLSPHAVPDIIAESAEDVPDGVVAILVTTPSANAEFRQLLRGPTASFDVDTFVAVGPEVDASVLTLYDESAPVGETTYYVTAAILGTSRAYSNVVTVDVSLGTRPNKPTVTQVYLLGVAKITDDSNEVLSSDFSDAVYPARSFAYARYTVKTTAGVVVASFDILPSENWQQPILTGLGPPSTTLRVYLEHFAIRTGEDAEFPPIPSLPSDPLEFTLLADGGVDEGDPIEIPILSTTFRSEYPFDTFAATVQFPDIDAYQLIVPCGFVAYPFYLRVLGPQAGSNLAGDFNREFTFLHAGKLHELESWYQYGCRDPDTGFFTGPLRNTKRSKSFIQIPFAPDTPNLLDGHCNIFGGKIIATDSFAFRWEEDERAMCVGASALGSTSPADYEDIDEVQPGLFRVNDFDGEFTIYGYKNGALVVLGTQPFGPRFYYEDADGVHWLRRAYYEWDGFAIEGWEETVDLTEFQHGYSQLGTRLDGRVLRTTSPFMVDRGEEAEIDGEQDTGFTTAGKTFAGTGGAAAEEARWSNISAGQGGGVRVARATGTGGYMALPALSTPRGVQFMLRGAWATKRFDSSSNGFKFVADMRSRWGAGVYLSDSVDGLSAIVGRVQGFFGATGTHYVQRQGEGATEFSWWGSGVRYALGLGYKQINTYGPNGTPIFATGWGPLEIINQWNRTVNAFGGENAEYTIYVQTRLVRTLTDGSHEVEVYELLHGPDRDTLTLANVTPRLVRFSTWPCGEIGFFSEASSYSTVEFYGWAAMVTDMGDCAVIEAPSDQILVAWAFTLDGHVFYVLNSVSGKSYVYDFTTGQWHRWTTQFRDYWNMFRGLMWKGKVLAADATLPKVFELDAYSELDEEALEIARIVTGFQAIRGKQSFRQGDMRVTASVGSPSAASAVILLRFSDDGGNTWSQYYDIDLAEDAFSQKLKFRSLGRLRAPGRLWELSDTGGLIRIEGADARIDLPDS